MKSLIFVFLTFAALSATAEERFVLDLGQNHYRGQQTIPLKQEINRQYGPLNYNEYQVKRVRVLAKSNRGGGQMTLRVGNFRSASQTVPGRPADFGWDHRDSYHVLMFRSVNQPAQGPLQLLLRGNNKVLRVVVVLERNHVQPRGNEVCIQFRRRSPSSGWYDTGWLCSERGLPSAAASLGDDTGWKDQQLRIRTTGRQQVCLTFSHWSNTTYTNTQCSSDGNASGWLWLGDDTGYKQQSLYVVNFGRQPICIKNARYSPNSGWYKSGWSCSANGTTSASLSLGDDTGWRNQELQIRAN